MRLINTWIYITLGASLIGVFDGGWLSSMLSLAPQYVWHGQIWRLVTWALIETSPLRLMLLCVTIYVLGSELATMWGERRLRRFMIEVLGSAAVVATLLALISRDAWEVYRLGGWAVGDALVIAWARQYPRHPVVIFYGLLTLPARDLLILVIVFNVLFALFAPFTMALELLVCAAAYYYPAARLARA